MATVNAYYLEEHDDQPLRLNTADDVHAMFADIRKQKLGQHLLISLVLAEDPYHSEFYIGLNGEHGVLSYTSRDEDGYSHQPEGSNTEPVIYFYVTSDTEFPPNSEIDLKIVEQAAVEYLESDGTKPMCVHWQTRATV
jgi:hypothetical protein